MLDASRISLNARFMLWKKGIVRSDWIGTLTAMLHWDESRAESLLAGNVNALNDEEMETLAGFGEISPGELTSQNLLEMSGIDIFHKNLTFLVDLVPYGEKKRFAEEIGVDPTTVSRWKTGSQHPTRKNIISTLRYFGLSDNTDMGNDPLFLSTAPIGAADIRKWIHQQIETADDKTLLDLLPVLIKIFKRQ